MAERSFPIENFFLSGRAHTGPVAKCRHCGVKEYFPRAGGTISAQKFFQNKGWELGRSHHMDMCPECRKPVRKHEPKPKVTEMEKPSEPTSSKWLEAAKKAETPRAISREDRKRIHEAIGLHYLDVGYEPPWTDKLIAENLKVPQAWVAEIRDEFFGDEGSNDVFDKFRQDAAVWMDEWCKLQAVCGQIDALKSLGDELDAMRKKIERDLVGKMRSG